MQISGCNSEMSRDSYNLFDAENEIRQFNLIFGKKMLTMRIDAGRSRMLWFFRRQRIYTSGSKLVCVMQITETD